MNIKLLRAFHHVVMEKSFTNAAKKLFLTQPAISAQIQVLENDLGVKLLRRDKKTKEILLTDEGELLLRYVEKLFVILDEMTATFKDLKMEKDNTVNIGTTTVYGAYFFPEILRSYVQKYPKVRMNNFIGNSHEILQQLLKSEIELAVIRGRIEGFEEFDQELIHTEKLIMIAAPDHELVSRKNVKIKDISKYPFIHREKGSHTREQVDKWLVTNGIDVSSTIELGNIESTKKSVAEGVGISIAPRIALERELNEGTLVEINVDGFAMEAQYYLVCRDKENLTVPALNLISTIHDCTPRGR
jgi:DNA-binding transcriptional LysR family regulator